MTTQSPSVTYNAESADFGASAQTNTATKTTGLLCTMLEATCPCSFTKLPSERATNMSRVQMLVWPLEAARAAWRVDHKKWYIGGAQLAKTSCLVSTYDTKQKKMMTRSLTSIGELRGSLTRKLKKGNPVIVALHSTFTPAPLHDSAARAANPSSSTPLADVVVGTRLLISPSMWVGASGGVDDDGPEYVLPATLVRATSEGALTIRIDMHPGKFPAILEGVRGICNSPSNDAVLYMQTEARKRIQRHSKPPKVPPQTVDITTEEQKSKDESKEAPKKRRTKKKLSAKQVHRNDRQTTYRADYRSRVMVLVCSNGDVHHNVQGSPITEKDKVDILGKVCPGTGTETTAPDDGTEIVVRKSYTFNEASEMHYTKRTAAGIASAKWKVLSKEVMREAGNFVTKETTREWTNLSDAEKSVFNAKAMAIAMAAEAPEAAESIVGDGEESSSAQDFSMKRSRPPPPSSSDDDDDDDAVPVQPQLPITSAFASTVEESIPHVAPARRQAKTEGIADLMRVEGREIIRGGHRVQLYYPLKRQRGVYSTSLTRDDLAWDGVDDYLPPADPTNPAFSIGEGGCVPPRGGLHLTGMRPKLSSISHVAALDLGNPITDIESVARWYNNDFHVALPPRDYDRTTHTAAEIGGIPGREIALMHTPDPADPTQRMYMDVNPLYLEQHDAISHGEFMKRRRDYNEWVAANSETSTEDDDSDDDSDDGEETS